MLSQQQWHLVAAQIGYERSLLRRAYEWHLKQQSRVPNYSPVERHQVQ